MVPAIPNSKLVAAANVSPSCVNPAVLDKQFTVSERRNAKTSVPLARYFAASDCETTNCPTVAGSLAYKQVSLPAPPNPPKPKVSFSGLLSQAVPKDTP